MKQKHILLFMIFLAVCAAALPGSLFATENRGIGARPMAPTGEKVTGDQWLMVIGVDTYIEWPRLKTAVNDAKALRDVLLDRYYFDKDHLVELYDEQATRSNILGKLRYLAKNIKEDDSLLIFYAGHGYLDPITKEGSWVPVESGTKDVSAWVSNHDIKNYLRVDAIKARHILLVSDSCFAGDFFRGHRGKLPEVNDKVIKKAYGLSSRQAISSGGLEPVSDAGFGNNSVFTHFLVASLKNNQEPFLLPSAFFSDVRAGVAENAQQFPQFGALHGAGGQEGGEMVFFLKQDNRLETLKEDASTKQQQLEQLEAMSKEQELSRQKEQVAIAQQEKDLAEMDARILAMKKNLGSSASLDANGGLMAMLAMVEQKEAQQVRLDELKRQRQADERERQQKLENLQAEKKAKYRDQVEKDIAAYEKIVSSEFGKGMEDAAWQSLVKQYPGGVRAPAGNIGWFKAVVLGGEEGQRNDRFLGNNWDGTVIDTKTGLMWAAKDNGRDINWYDAKRYCENYSGGGYNEWRLPTQDELDGLYVAGIRHASNRIIDITSCCPWASETRGSEAASFNFFDLHRSWYDQSSPNDSRALPVRNAQ